MVIEGVRSEVFGAQQGGEHVDGHGDCGGDVDDGEDHRSDPPQQDSKACEQGEHRRPERDIDEVHEIWLQFWSQTHIARRHQGSAAMDAAWHKKDIKKPRLGAPAAAAENTGSRGKCGCGG
jgi:hypothetical protein